MPGEPRKEAMNGIQLKKPGANCKPFMESDQNEIRDFGTVVKVVRSRKPGVVSVMIPSRAPYVFFLVSQSMKDQPS